jgi:hypothetical protein
VSKKTKGLKQDSQNRLWLIPIPKGDEPKFK